MIRLTDWFPPARTPDLIGYYDTQVNFEPPMVLFWDGFRWRASEFSPRYEWSAGTFWRPRSWRGLAEDPAIQDSVADTGEKRDA